MTLPVISCHAVSTSMPLPLRVSVCRPDCGALHGGGGRAHGLASPPGKQGLSDRIEWLPVQPAGAPACAGLCRRLRSCRRCLTGTPSCCFPAVMCFCFHMPCRPTARTAPRSRRCGCERVRAAQPSCPAATAKRARNQLAARVERCLLCRCFGTALPPLFPQSPPLNCPHLLPHCLLHVSPDVRMRPSQSPVTTAALCNTPQHSVQCTLEPFMSVPAPLTCRASASPVGYSVLLHPFCRAAMLGLLPFAWPPPQLCPTGL